MEEDEDIGDTMDVNTDKAEETMREDNELLENYASLDLKDRKYLKSERGKYYSLLRDLSLEEVCSYNFGLKDLLTVTRCSLKGEEPQTLKENILYIISKLIMLDYRSRNTQLFITKKELCESSISLQCVENKIKFENKIQIEIPEHDISSDTDEDDELKSILMELSEGSQQLNTNLMHPLDVIVIIMNSCDNILRQILVQKMALCQLAIPLVLPNLHSDEPLFILWAMRLMCMKWKTQLTGAQDINAIDHPTQIVSAIRLGDLSRSKSKILNDVLCNQPHDIFFHRDCEAGNSLRKLSDGVIEIAWYLPGGKNEDKEDNFEDIMALANLRSDAKDHSKQFELLSTVSSVMLIFISLQIISDPEYYSMLKMLATSNQRLVFVFLDEVSPKNMVDFKKLMGKNKFKTVLGFVKGKLKNSATLTNELRDKINVFLKKHLETESVTKKLNWETVSDIARCVGIKVDEDSKSCNDGKVKANMIITELQSEHVTSIKEQVLPLQGKLWTEWSHLSKMQARLDGVLGKDHETYISDLINKKEVCRKKQCSLVHDMNPVMNNFIQNLVQTKDNPESRIFFMQWMKLYLDGISQKELPELQRKFHSLWNDIQEQKNKKLNNGELKKETQNKLDKVERNLISSSFGLEHFMRELGQVYEAMIELKNITSDKFNHLRLPQFAADLLISGFPLEIMDGDASHVPLTWVKAVFNSLKIRLGDKKLYVISVLGVQSSGKSTLLNTMFGLNFAVSAGRCTKGVYAQLIPVANQLNNELGYDYILVLDTEGLRAPELGKSKHTHDNELATLVIGMGDVTIVNIKGENTAEIEDILQICVHAFLRMRLTNKSLKLQPGCYFVHQNVPDINADEKMAYGYKKIQEQLDLIAKAAAEEEDAREIQCFKDVIDFDVKTNVWYFPSLWQGDPPMAPANPGYSNKVLELKTNLLKYPSLKKINCLTLTDLQHRLSDLWNAILYENFVFSFKNSLEVKSYSNLEEKYSSLSWNFRNEIKKWIHGSINEILSCEEKNISSLHASIINSLITCISVNFSKYNKELNNFFISARDKDILVKWKSETEIRIKSLSDELKSEARKTCDSYFEIRRAQFVQENKTDAYQKQLHLFVKELVKKNVNGNMSSESLNKMFAEKWNEWMDRLSFEGIEKKDIIGDVRTILSEVFRKNNKLLWNEISQYAPFEADKYDLDNIPNICVEDYSYSLYGMFKNNVKKMMSMNYMEPIIQIQIFTREIMNEVKTYLSEKKYQDYDKNFIHEICNNVYEKVHQFNLSQPYVLQMNYCIKVIVHIFRNVIPFFKIKHRQFRQKNDPRHFLEENFKPQLEKFFLGTVSQCMQEKTAADIFISSIEKAILESLKRDLPRTIADNVTSSNSDFHTKINLYTRVMIDLGTMKDFDNYLQYIMDPNAAMGSWLKYYVSNYCTLIKGNGHSNLVNDANGILVNTINTLKQCVKDVNVSSHIKPISFRNWLQKYHLIGKRIIPLQDNLFNIFDSHQVKDMTYFEEMIFQGLGDIQTNLEMLIINWNIDEFDNLYEGAHLLIAENILGCTERCPFCYAICVHTIQGHADSHSTVKHHRPIGIGGYRDNISGIMTVASCNVRVASSNGVFTCRDWKCKCHESVDCEYWHKYKEYNKVSEYYASWRISPDTSLEGSEYWKWVFCEFSTQFAKHYNAIPPEIPSSWHTITWEEAKKSIGKSF